jgi:hypothetical protein
MTLQQCFAKLGGKVAPAATLSCAPPPPPPHPSPRQQISFFALHWSRGSPIWEDQGEHIEETVWEQIDNGVPWTSTRKFLLTVPIALCVLRSCGERAWDQGGEGVGHGNSACERIPLTPLEPPSIFPSSSLLPRSFVVSSHFTSYDFLHLVINVAILAVLIIAKIPEMHGVRIFSVNRASVD